MKIIYLGSLCITDSDFPLIRELQNKGVKVISYFPLSSLNQQSGLFSINKIIEQDTIIPAKEYPEFAEYRDYINIDDMYIINNFHHRLRDFRSWKLWLKVLVHMKKQNAELIHSVWPFTYQDLLLYFLKIKKVFTVHDPFSHSGQSHWYKEFTRKLSFKKADGLVLLNKEQKSDFCKHYKIETSKTLDNIMGEFSCYRFMPQAKTIIKGDYLLFFGNIHPHKGVEYLLEAMEIVHSTYPDVKLVVAGKGSYYFDYKRFEKNDYMIFINKYITVPELVTLLKNCLFTVVPYKDATQSGVVQTAFSLNVPIVSTNVGALPEAITDRETGLLVPLCDAASLSKSILELLEDKSMLAYFKKNIEDKWRKKMSWSPIADKYLEFYKSL